MADVTKKKSFILFADFMNAVNVLSNEQAGRLFKLVFAYVNGLNTPKSEDPAIAAMFEMFRSQIDRETEKWLEICWKNKENSHKRNCYIQKNAADVERHRPISADKDGCPPTSDDILNDNDSDNVCDSEPLSTSITKNTLTDNQYSFDGIWKLYGKFVGDEAFLRKRWGLLSDVDKAAIYEYVPGYVASRPMVMFRKNFENFLSQRVWENEPLNYRNYGNQARHEPNATRSQSVMQDAAELIQELLGDDSHSIA